MLETLMSVKETYVCMAAESYLYWLILWLEHQLEFHVDTLTRVFAEVQINLAAVLCEELSPFFIKAD